MKKLCPKYNIYVDENFDCHRCPCYTLTDHLQGNIYGYECSYEAGE
jgi:hypothetical protein